MRNKGTIFNDIPTIQHKRAKHKLNQEIKLTGNVGALIPSYWCEVLPGDTMAITSNKVIRLTTPITPFMDNLQLDTYWFFVPNRLIWSHWKNFMGESEKAWYDPSVEYTIPTIKAPAETGFTKGTIADYLGYPTGIALDEENVLPIRAYAQICQDWFINEALQDPLLIPLDDSTQTGTNSGLNYIEDVANGGMPFIANKLRDYFTSCLPSPQYGDPVSISIGDVTGNVFGTGKTLAVTDGNDLGGVTNYQGSLIGYDTFFNKIIGSAKESGDYLSDNVGFGIPTKELLKSKMGDNFDPKATGLIAEVDGGNIITINELRMAFAVQQWQEAIARSGNRYHEIIEQLFGVSNPDSRMQRAEYLGGNSIPVVVNQVLATDGDTVPTGTTGAYSLTIDSHFDVNKSFSEHGILMCCMCIRYRHTYQQGANRFLMKRTKNDFFNPIFENIGEQGVKYGEIYKQGESVLDEDTGKPYDLEIFGYQEAWSEYRHLPNRTAGEMRSTYSTPLDKWHLGDNYAELPTLSAEWGIEDKNNVDRVLTVKSTVSDQFIADLYFVNDAIREVPQYSIPGLMKL